MIFRRVNRVQVVFILTILNKLYIFFNGKKINGRKYDDKNSCGPETTKSTLIVISTVS